MESNLLSYLRPRCQSVDVEVKMCRRRGGQSSEGVVVYRSWASVQRIESTDVSKLAALDAMHEIRGPHMQTSILAAG